MTTANPGDAASYRRTVQATIRRAADDFRRLADALEAVAAEVDRAGGPHPASDAARTAIQQVQAAGALVDYAGMLRAAADHDALMAGGVVPAMGSASGSSARLPRRAAAAAPPPAPVSPVSPNTLWVGDDRYLWISGINAKGTAAECWAWRDQANVRLRPATVPVAQFQDGYLLADEQQYRRAAQIIAALRGAGVDVSPMRPLLEYAKKLS